MHGDGGGVPVTEETIQQWADEAEKGYDVAQLRKRGRKPLGDGPARVVPVRRDDTLVGALDMRAQQDHITRSDLIPSSHLHIGRVKVNPSALTHSIDAVHILHAADD
ncbi:MAG: hypothetical protein ACRCY9_08905 [Phycicoccus sp.]